VGLPTVPAAGIVGEAALREAAATELGQINALVRAALTKAMGGGYVSVSSIFPTRVVVHGEGGRLYAYDYAIDDKNQVTLGEPTEVLIDYQTVALREAAAGEFNQTMDLLRDELRRHYGLGANDWVCTRAVYADRVIAERGGRLFEFSYTISDDNKVTLGDPVEVVLEPTPIGKRKTPMREAAPAPVPSGRGLGEAAGAFIEALAADASQPNASRYLVRVIRAGLSLNGVDYPAAVLREAAPRFDGVRVFAKSDDDHIQGNKKAKDFRNLVGRLVQPKFVEATDGSGGEIQAVLEVLDSSDVAAKLREAVQRDMTDMFGLSIDAAGREKRRGKFREATSIARIDSVDLIISPGAGGQVIRFAEAHQEQDTMLRQQMLDQIRARDAKRAAALADASDEDVLTAYREACAEPATGTASLADVESRIAMIEARAQARVAIADSRLPPPLQQRLQTRFAEAATFTAADVTNAITAERTLLTQLREADGAHIRGLGSVEAGEDRSEKVSKMLDDFFDRSKPGFSFREAYIEITGDRRVTGLVQNCDMQRMREAVGESRFAEAISASTFGDILGDSITRAMIRDYGALESYNDWRWLADVVPVNDFRTQERTRLGGYGNLPAVAENGPYNAGRRQGDVCADQAWRNRDDLAGDHCQRRRGRDPAHSARNGYCGGSHAVRVRLRLPGDQRRGVRRSGAVRRKPQQHRHGRTRRDFVRCSTAGDQAPAGAEQQQAARHHAAPPGRAGRPRRDGVQPVCPQYQQRRHVRAESQADGARRRLLDRCEQLVCDGGQRAGAADRDRLLRRQGRPGDLHPGSADAGIAL
jgi:hypothetical protein